MSRFYLAFLIISILLATSSLGQNNWYQITPTNTFDGFSLPAAPQLAVDSPMLKLFKLDIDSQLILSSAFEG